MYKDLHLSDCFIVDHRTAHLPIGPTDSSSWSCSYAGRREYHDLSVEDTRLDKKDGETETGRTEIQKQSGSN
jgi:hypothetical protein